MARQDAAIDDSACGLRQRIVRVAGIEARGNAGCAHGRVREWVGIKTRDGSRVRRILKDGFHVRGNWAWLDGGHLPEIRAGDSVQLEGELIMLDARDSVGEMVDRVVCDGQRTVPAGIFHLKLIIGIELFRGVDRHHHRLAIARVDATAIGIQNECRVDEVAMIAQQPVDAV